MTDTGTDFRWIESSDSDRDGDSARDDALVLRPTRWTTWLAFIGCGLFVAVAWWLIPEHPWVGWAGAIFFGLGLVVIPLSMLPGSSYLKLTDDGFTMRGMYRSFHYAWSDVDRFTSVRLTYGNKMVVFNFTKEFEGHRRGRKWAKTVCGFEGGILSYGGLSSDDLAALMNRYRDEATRSEKEPTSDR